METPAESGDEHLLGHDLSTGLSVRWIQGRYGPYVTDGRTSASCNSAEQPGLAEALELLAQRRP